MGSVGVVAGSKALLAVLPDRRRYVEKIPVDRPIGRERHRSHEFDLLVREPTGGWNDLECRTLELAGDRRERNRLLSRRKSVWDWAPGAVVVGWARPRCEAQCPSRQALSKQRSHAVKFLRRRRPFSVGAEGVATKGRVAHEKTCIHP
jgi:hypothetical protein